MKARFNLLDWIWVAFNVTCSLLLWRLIFSDQVTDALPYLIAVAGVFSILWLLEKTDKNSKF